MLLSFQALTYGMIIFVDRFIFETLDLINRHARISYKQVGASAREEVTSWVRDVFVLQVRTTST